MGTIQYPHTAFFSRVLGVRRGPPVTARRGRALLRTFDWLAACHERGAQRRILASLDDRMLKDIGLGRGDVAEECAKPFWRP